MKPEVLKQIREGQPTGDAKRDALVGFVRKLAQSSGTVSDEDFALGNGRLAKLLQRHRRAGFAGFPQWRATRRLKKARTPSLLGS